MKVCVYPGSFNPYHVGHENVRQKALKIFDKVILARGINPEKPVPTYPLPKSLVVVELMEYQGLLTDFIKSLKSKYDNITVVRGLRNAVDLEYEKNQYRWLQDLMPEIQVVSIFPDAEFEHVSSSGIKMLSKYGEELVSKYLLP